MAFVSIQGPTGGLTFPMNGVSLKWFYALFERSSNQQILWNILLPILLPGLIAVALFGFTLSYDEFPRTMITVGQANTLPLEIWAMTTNVTSPALYALGTVTTVISFVAIIISLGSIALIQSRRTGRR